EGRVKTVAVLGGSGKDLISSASKAGADVFVTGESGYNAAETAAEAGLCIIEAGHYHTEAPVCRVLADHVKNLGLEVEIFEYSPYVDM
ncbi:MAG: Nif3-like dinuclear metal center hexameric protein, partial [Clostridia bacterium]|nr:Nif3-like dinuclear metal center hexameric protein [Clostridia bacterium]